MTGNGFDPPVRLHSINAIKDIGHARELCCIRLISRGDDIEIERINRSAIENGRQPPYHDKIHTAFVQNAQRRQEITVRHLIFVWPGSHSRGAVRTVGAPPASGRASSESTSNRRHLRCNRSEVEDPVPSHDSLNSLRRENHATQRLAGSREPSPGLPWPLPPYWRGS